MKKISKKAFVNYACTSGVALLATTQKPLAEVKKHLESRVDDFELHDVETTICTRTHDGFKRGESYLGLNGKHRTVYKLGVFYIVHCFTPAGVNSNFDYELSVIYTEGN